MIFGGVRSSTSSEAGQQAPRRPAQFVGDGGVLAKGPRRQRQPTEDCAGPKASGAQRPQHPERRQLRRGEVDRHRHRRRQDRGHGQQLPIPGRVGAQVLADHPLTDAEAQPTGEIRERGAGHAEHPRQREQQAGVDDHVKPRCRTPTETP